MRRLGTWLNCPWGENDCAQHGPGTLVGCTQPTDLAAGDQGHLVTGIDLPTLVGRGRAGPLLRASSRGRRRPAVAAQPTPQRALAGQGLAGEGLGQGAQEEACAPIRVASLEFPSTAEDVGGGVGVAGDDRAVGSRPRATVMASPAEKMADGTGRQREALGQFGGR